MKQRHFITTLCLLMLFVASAWAQKNTLEIPDVTVAQGKSISLPVNMKNSADIVAVQFTMTTADGVEYLLHIGIDTVKLEGKGFNVFVENGQEVKKGDKLMEFDDEFIKANAPSDACLCIFTDLEDGQEVHLAADGNVKAGDQAVWF